MKSYIIICWFLFCSFLAGSQPINTAKIDSLFTSLEKNNRAMGSIAISKNGELLYARAIGYSQINGGFKLYSDVSTKYRIGSITKMFTTVIAFQLIEEGKLKLSSPLSKFYPEIKNAKSITISNLLNHRSGISNFTNDTAYMSWMMNEKTHKEIIEYIKKGGSDFEPNTKAEYSNSNFVLLGYIIEAICKKDFSEILNDRITKKIDLQNSYYGSKTNIQKNECYSYSFDSVWVQETETHMSVPHAAGAIVSNPTDLTKFIEALFTYKLVNKSSLAQITTMKEKYGMGIFITPFYEHMGYGHTGGIDGFTSALTYFKEDSISVAYTSNGKRFAMNDILIGVLSCIYNKPYKIPTFDRLVLTSTDLDKYLGFYSNKGFPLQLTVKKEGNVLQVTATGQATIDMDAIEKDKFQFEEAGIIVEFRPDKNELRLLQGGLDIIFKREN